MRTGVGLASAHQLFKPKHHLSPHFVVCINLFQGFVVGHMAHVTLKTVMTKLVRSHDQRPGINCFLSIC